MTLQKLIMGIAASLLLTQAVCAQHAAPPSRLADDLCQCLGKLDPEAADAEFDPAVRACLNASVTDHPGEVIDLLRRYPTLDRKFYLLGLVLGSALDRSCPEYLQLKERLHQLRLPAQRSMPAT